MTSEVSDLIKELRAGTKTLDEVAQRFRERKWPRRKRSPATYLEMAARTMEDPEPYLPGSFDDVSAAFHRGDLSRESIEFCPTPRLSRSVRRIANWLRRTVTGPEPDKRWVGQFIQATTRTAAVPQKSLFAQRSHTRGIQHAIGGGAGSRKSGRV